ncbi:translation elongation factor 2 (EF-2/EF-G) [Desulfomicrobium norvegicum]|uniref:Elongation factor G n=1 Tax=Desulfomicrobium norvegicum (strain DSM 1741 / NCIMB 8310) TaxID=52561 RepID=A0A8G2C1J6_DESNO|nr:elongation factor G [Desulfomicrobium norvegicum]SFL51807.1 translation elongation factor 2 (EF-2/EF-G) [Desulfomicrobium norvegicum]
MQDQLQKQRTFALIGHGGTGKTSVAEMLLFAAGSITRLGKIDEGSTVLDYEPEEIKRRGSIQPGFAQLPWKKNLNFLIDTPGDNNFIGDLPYLLQGADNVILVIDAIDGVKPLTKKIWSEAVKASLPAMVFINKMDRERANFQMAYQGLIDVLGMKPVLLYLPIGSEADFRGLVDVLADKAYAFDENGGLTPIDMPEDLADEVTMTREIAIENIAESSEELMEKYLEEGSLTDEEVATGLRAGIAARMLVPVCVGAAMQNKGAVTLLDTIQNLMTSPLEHEPWLDAEGNERPSSPDAPFAAFVFKTIADPFAGQLSVLRVLSGVLSPDASVLNATKDEKEKIGQILFLEGKKQTPCKQEVGPGAIVAVAKLKNTATGDTLCAEKAPFILPKPALSPSIISYALAAEEKGEEDKVFAAVQKLLDEDINLHLVRNDETGDMLLTGMGQLHIELAVEKVRRRYKTNILLKTPKIPYRETIKGKAQVQGRHKKQSGGRGQFGDCWIRMEPNARSAGYEFLDEIVGGSIPRNYIPAVDKGVQEAAARGFLAGYPMVDFKVAVYDGSYHNVDSSEMAFKIAGSLAFKKAVEMCNPILLEPIMLAAVFIPDEFMGDVIGDLSSRRGRVLGSDSIGGVTEVKAHVPMAEMMKYAPDLRSMTGGQGTFTMEFAHYEECPPNVAEQVIADSKKEED